MGSLCYIYAVNIDQKYMSRCMELGQNALGMAAPNPMVGAVVVYKNTIIGEGYTSPFGGPHAEVNAIASVQDKSLLKQATLYVSLEPCSHFGKTPPCADLIVKHNIPEVVIGILDPNPKVAGLGLKKLEAHGCKVRYGILEKKCRFHHRRFLTNFEKKRPYIILKWAQTQDGFIAPAPVKRPKKPEPYWITTTQSRQLVHKWRSEEAAILVGTKTALEDNPRLDVRDWYGKSPVRLVLDKHIKLPATHHLLDGTTKTYVFHGNEKKPQSQSENVIFVPLDFTKNIPLQLCSFLYEKQLGSVIVEGGRATLQHFLDADLWDEARIFTGASTFGEGIPAPTINKGKSSQQPMMTDTLNIRYHETI